MCWAFNTVPSRLRDYYRDYSYNDLKTQVQIKTGEKMADTMQLYESVALVISAALGGKKQRTDPTSAPQTMDQLEAALARSLG